MFPYELTLIVVGGYDVWKRSWQKIEEIEKDLWDAEINEKNFLWSLQSFFVERHQQVRSESVK